MSTKYKRKELEYYGWDKSKDINDKEELLNFFQNHHASEKFISYLFPELYNKINEISELSIFTKFSQKLYHFLYNDLELNIGKCPTCGKRCRFVNFKAGYKKYCNAKCQMSDPNMLFKIKKTCLEKYGVDHPLKSELIKDKIYQTNYKKYGNKIVSKTEYCKEKAKNTCLRKYGATAYSKTNEYKQYMQSYEIYPAQRQDVKEERAKTCKEKYGAVCFLQSKEYFDSIHGKKLDKLSKLERGIEEYFKKI